MLKNALENLKEEEESTNSVPTIIDKNVLIAISGWGHSRVIWDPPADIEKIPEDKFDLWNLLWSFSCWDIDEIAVIIGRSSLFTSAQINRARKLHLIYPDGTISNGAREALIALAQKMNSAGSKCNKKEREIDSFYKEGEEDDELPQ